MIVTSNTTESREAMYLFLRDHGVEIPRSEDFQALGRLKADRSALMGVVGYNGFCGRTCAMHVAGEGNWVNRDLLWTAFDYPFNQVGVRQVFGCAAANNERALRLDHHLGFKEVMRVKDGWYDGVDMVILTMSRSECRWLEKRYERVFQKAA